MVQYIPLVKKVCVSDTLQQFAVGQKRVFKNSEVKYTTLYPSVKRLEKRTGMRFTVTMKGVPDGGVLVIRDA